MITKCFVIIVISQCLLLLAQAQQCVTPDRTPGACLPISSCRPIVNALFKGYLSSDERKYIRNSYCGYRNEAPLVCCGEWKSGVINPPPRERRPVPATRQVAPLSPLLPRAPQCGNSIDDRIIGGKEAGLDEFPWMALLQYRTARGSLVFSCGGSLINNRYIMTAAHCVTGAINRVVGPLVSVRLGEYDTRTDIDCIQDVSGDQDCSDPVQDVLVERTIPHNGYVDGSHNNQHDIALVRLAQEVRMGDFVKPICIPEFSTPEVKSGDRFSIAGWGQTLTANRSNIKLKIEVPFVPVDACQNVFNGYNVKLADSQLCAGGLNKQDSCQGDSGGPLMRNVNSAWYCEGLVSFGVGCGVEGNPGVYTKVRLYVDWINSNIQP